MDKKDLKEEEVLESESQEEESEEEAETSEDTKTSEVDYKEELERVKERLKKKETQVGQAEHVIEKLKKEKGGGQLDPSTIEEIVERKLSEFTESVRGDAINNLVSSYASNEDEAELIKYHLKHSIRPSGDDEADILNAKALANKARLSQAASERMRSEGRPPAEKERGAGAKDAPPKEIKLSQKDQEIARAFGLSKEEIAKGYQR